MFFLCRVLDWRAGDKSFRQAISDSHLSHHIDSFTDEVFLFMFPLVSKSRYRYLKLFLPTEISMALSFFFERKPELEKEFDTQKNQDSVFFYFSSYEYSVEDLVMSCADIDNILPNKKNTFMFPLILSLKQTLYVIQDLVEKKHGKIYTLTPEVKEITKLDPAEINSHGAAIVSKEGSMYFPPMENNVLPTYLPQEDNLLFFSFFIFKNYIIRLLINLLDSKVCNIMVDERPIYDEFIPRFSSKLEGSIMTNRFYFEPSLGDFLQKEIRCFKAQIVDSEFKEETNGTQRKTAQGLVLNCEGESLLFADEDNVGNLSFSPLSAAILSFIYSATKDQNIEEQVKKEQLWLLTANKEYAVMRAENKGTSRVFVCSKKCFELLYQPLMNVESEVINFYTEKTKFSLVKFGGREVFTELDIKLEPTDEAEILGLFNVCQKKITGVSIILGKKIMFYNALFRHFIKHLLLLVKVLNVRLDKNKKPVFV